MILSNVSLLIIDPDHWMLRGVLFGIFKSQNGILDIEIYASKIMRFFDTEDFSSLKRYRFLSILKANIIILKSRWKMNGYGQTQKSVSKMLKTDIPCVLDALDICFFLRTRYCAYALVCARSKETFPAFEK